MSAMTCDRAVRQRPGKALRRHHRHQQRLAGTAAGRAPRADRPQRRRQDHADQSADRRAGAHRRPHRAGGQDITRLAPHQRVRRGMVRTFQINQLFDSMTPLETLALVVSQQQGIGARWWQPLGAAAVASAARNCWSSSTWPNVRTSATRAPGLRQAPAAGDRHRAGLRAARAAAGRAGGRRARRASARNCCRPWPPCRPMCRCC